MKALAFGARQGVGITLIPSRTEHRVKGRAELLIVVADQKVDGGLALIQGPHHLARLLSDPGIIGMGRAAREVDPTRANFDENEHVQCLEKWSLDGEKSQASS